MHIGQIDELLKLMVDEGASDLHLKVPSPPVLRIDGVLIPQEDWPPVTPKDIEMAFEHITTQSQGETFLREMELDFAYSLPGLARFRVNALKQRGTWGLAFRLVPFVILSIDELGLPQILKELVLKPRGLILVTGPTGSGKSTTLAAMIDHLNETKKQNVITIEDPIEFLYRDKRCIIAQRDLGDDTKSFSTALIHALRHDPDVIVVGEMRDLETIISKAAILPPQMRGKRVCDNIASITCDSWSLICCCWLDGNISIIRSTVWEASIVCSVPNTKCPVSAALIAVDMVSKSRISPTTITSGSWRRACIKAVAKDLVSSPKSR